MRKRLLFLFLICVVTVNAQITKSHQEPRIGDELIKQQVEFIEPGPAGQNILWDFSGLKSVNDEYKVVYSAAPLLSDSVYIMGYNEFAKADKAIQSKDLLVATEHNTMYYYRIKGDSLLLLGHENPVVKLQYDSPYQLLTYPFGYGKRMASTYSTQGYYSGTERIRTAGTIETIGDAYGSMILPTGDTVRPVVRIKTIQTIEDKLPENKALVSEILATTSTPSVKQLETCRWYMKGYRYPIFETVKNTNLSDNTLLFATAFFFPPQDHLYLDTDPENQKLLDEMWDFTDKQNKVTTTEENKLISDYRFYPNPVRENLNLSYNLNGQAQVKISIYSVTDGRIFYQSKNQQMQAGEHMETIDCIKLPQGSYVIQILTNNQVSIAEPIIKK